MDVNSAKLIGAGLAMTGLIGAGAGLGILFGNYLQAAIRNPAAAAGERTYLFLGMANCDRQYPKSCHRLLRKK